MRRRVNSEGAQLAPGILEERRSHPVKWDQAVVKLAILGAEFAWLVGAALAGLWVIYFNYNHQLDPIRPPLSWWVSLVIPALAGSVLAGIVGLTISILKDWGYEYDQVKNRRVASDDPPLDQELDPLDAGPLERRVAGGRIIRGQVNLTTEQKLALASMVVESKETVLSGRKLEAYGVIPDRNARHRGGQKTVVQALHEDLLRAEYGAQDGASVAITQRGYDYLEGLIPEIHYNPLPPG